MSGQSMTHEQSQPLGRDTSFSHALVDRAKAKLEELTTLISMRAELEADIVKAKAYLDALNSVLEAEGLDRVAAPAEYISRPSMRRSAPRRKDTAIPRHPPFDSMRDADAVSHVLQDGVARHADYLVSVLFDTDEPSEMTLAKQSLASTLRREAKAGRWQKVGPNTYQAPSSTSRE